MAVSPPKAEIEPEWNCPPESGGSSFVPMVKHRDSLRKLELLSAAEHVEAAEGGNRISPQAEIVRQKAADLRSSRWGNNRDSLRKP
jgi:hypothetical protein